MTLLKTAVVSTIIVTIGCSLPSSESRQKQDSEPEQVTLCQLKNDRAAYNHKLVQVTGFVSHGFEDFTLTDPSCSSRFDVWLEYGGTAASGTMYCCGVTAARDRPQQLLVENISVPLVDDERFHQFDKLLQRRPDSVVRATIIGRFFSGEKSESAGGVFWGGYGHLGCCSLLAIQQIASVDPQDREDLDYGATVDQPGGDKEGCGYKDLIDSSGSELIQFQRRADEGERDWSFVDPGRVAIDGLARILKIDEKSITGMKETRKEQGRVVYQWRPRASRKNYMTVVSRPYLLSVYAKDPKKVAWVVMAAYEFWCD